MRVTAHLADAQAGTQVWSERYDHALSDLFDLQIRVTADIVAAIAPQIEVTETLRARSHRPADSTRHEQAMQAWALANDADRDPLARDRALVLAQSVIAADPSNALAWRSIAWSQAQQVYYDTTPQPAQAAAASLAAATRAVELDAGDHRGYVYGGLILAVLGRPDESLADLRRALELNANDVLGLSLLGFMEALCGDAPTGVTRAKEALRRSPRDPRRYLLFNLLAWALFGGQEYLQAVAIARQAIAERPSYPQIHLCLALVFIGLGDVPRAREAFAQARALSLGYVQSRLDDVWLASSSNYRALANRFIRIAAGMDAA